jgi:hypothetical protein
MGKINATRVLLGGLLAGVVINVSESFWYGFVFMRDMEQAMAAALTKPVNTGGGFIAIMILWGFLIGILSVWVYAAVRPRFGAGPKTAVRTGLMLWLLVYVQVTISFAPMGLIPPRIMLLGLPISLVEIVLATLAGASVYKEQAVA